MPGAPSFPVWVLAAVVLLAGVASAGDDAILRGSVVDESGAALPGATVVLLIGSESRQTVSDPDGQFRLDGVPRGAAVVRVSLNGFQPAEVPIAISSETPPPVTVRLTVAFEQDVQVAGSEEPDALSAGRNAAVEIDSAALRNVPTDGQDLQSLIEQFVAAPGGVSIVVDGGETDALHVPAASIHRLTINRSPYSAEYSRPGKARVDVVTEVGSRKFFHGSGALFVRNAALDARNAFADADPDLDRRLFEGTFGGPLPRPLKGLSFFIGGERFTNDESAIVNAQTLAGAIRDNVPTGERRLTALTRIDWRPSKLRTINFRHDLFDDRSRNDGVGGFSLAEQAYGATERRHRFRLSEHEVFSDHLVNDVAVDITRGLETEGVLPLAPAVIVPGAFIGGPSQVFREDRSTSAQVQNLAAVSINGHMVRVGGRVKAKWTDLRDASNFGGTYEFASLDELARGSPLVFRRNQGDMQTSFVTTTAAGYAEVDFRPHKDVGVTAGLRYDWQSSIDDFDNLAPRISAAYAPGGGKTIIRVGAGLFFDDLPDEAVGRSLLFDGGIRELVVSRPTFPVPPAGSGRGSTSSAVWRLDEALTAPSITQASVGVERPLWRKSAMSAEYLATRGSNLFRARNINAANPVTGARADRSALEVDQIESTGSSRSDALTVMFRGRIEEFKGTVQYIWSRTIDDTSGPFDLPADNFNLAAERGRSDSDRRHRFNVTGVYEWPDWGVRLGGIVALASGVPFDITTGFDDNRDFVVNDRPQGVTRNTGQGPGRAQIDARLTKVFRSPRPASADPQSLKREYRENLELNVDIFNLLNRVNPTNYIGVLSSPYFGRANRAGKARTLQISLRYRF